jgi:cation diffusion facilitator family transporter
LQVDGVREIHHLHIWALSTTQNALTAHVVVASLEDGEAVKNRIKEILSEEHIPHATLELETAAECCTDRTD